MREIDAFCQPFPPVAGYATAAMKPDEEEEEHFRKRKKKTNKQKKKKKTEKRDTRISLHVHWTRRREQILKRLESNRCSVKHGRLIWSLYCCSCLDVQLMAASVINRQLTAARPIIFRVGSIRALSAIWARHAVAFCYRVRLSIHYARVIQF